MEWSAKITPLNPALSGIHSRWIEPVDKGFFVNVKNMVLARVTTALACFILGSVSFVYNGGSFVLKSPVSICKYTIFLMIPVKVGGKWCTLGSCIPSNFGVIELCKHGLKTVAFAVEVVVCPFLAIASPSFVIWLLSVFSLINIKKDAKQTQDEIQPVQDGVTTEQAEPSRVAQEEPDSVAAAQAGRDRAAQANRVELENQEDFRKLLSQFSKRVMHTPYTADTSNEEEPARTPSNPSAEKRKPNCVKRPPNDAKANEVIGSGVYGERASPCQRARFKKDKENDESEFKREQKKAESNSELVLPTNPQMPPNEDFNSDLSEKSPDELYPSQESVYISPEERQEIGELLTRNPRVLQQKR